MKKNSDLLVLAFLTMVALMWASESVAQTFEYPEPPDPERIAVRSQGSRPTISDFVTAFLDHSKANPFYGKVRSEWQRYLRKKPLSKHVSIILDTRNGYMHYEIVNPEEKDTMVMEMCFWNCADGKRRLVCANTYWVMENDYGWSEDVGTCFYVYDNKTRVMRTVWPEDIGALYDSDGLSVFFLPRHGKNIRVSAAGSGDRWNEVLEWDGYQFSSKVVP